MGRAITSPPANQSDIDLLNITQNYQVNWKISCVVTVNLVASLQDRVKFRAGDHTQIMQDGSADIRRRKTHNVGEALTAVNISLLPIDD